MNFSENFCATYKKLKIKDCYSVKDFLPKKNYLLSQLREVRSCSSVPNGFMVAKFSDGICLAFVQFRRLY